MNALCVSPTRKIWTKVHQSLARFEVARFQRDMLRDGRGNSDEQIKKA
jgi:hypothetical protein